jgi:hypothetical protein
MVIYFSWNSENHWIRLSRIGRIVH